MMQNNIQINPQVKMAILLIGAPGSGKTTWGKQFSDTYGIVRICPDEIRAKIGWGEGDQSVSAQAFAIAKASMLNAIELNRSVMIDATNMYRKTRKDFLEIAKRRNVKTIAIVFEETKSNLLDRNKKRGMLGGREVPEEVIDKMLQKYEPPIEGVEFDVIKYVNKL